MQFPAPSRVVANGSVLVKKEVTIVSDSSPTPKRSVDLVSSSRQYKHTNPRPLTTSATRTMTLTGVSQFDRWTAQSRMADRPSTRPRSQLSLDHHDTTALEESREGLSALAEFLMNKEPPATNFMSMPSDDERSLTSLKSSALKILGRQQKKKRTRSRPQKLLQLPDSAVSAKTLGGARHIAISIPIEYDHPEKEKAPIESQLPQRAQSQKIISDKGTVTVLKPVAELRESGASSFSPASSPRDIPTRDIESSGFNRPVSQATPPAEVLGPEATRTLENYYYQQRKLNLTRGTTPPGILTSTNFNPRTDSLPKPLQKSYIAVSPAANLQLHRTLSQQTSDPRHSGGSAYSNATFTSSPTTTTQHALSRGPSLTTPPPRSSSKSTTLTPIDSTVDSLDALLSPPPKTPTRVQSADPLPALEPGFSPTVFSTGTARIIRSYSAAGLHGGPIIVRSVTVAPPGPAPTRMLPLLPGAGRRPRPSSAPPVGSRSNSTRALKAAAEGGREGRFVNQLPVVENADGGGTRRERVRARKKRDMEALLTPPGTSAGPSVPQDVIVAAPLRNPRRSKDSGDRERPSSSASALSAIMVVADLEPISELAIPARSRRASPSSSQKTLRRPTTTRRRRSNDTPPESSTSLSEDSDTIPPPTLRSPASVASMRSVAGSELQNRRLERRQKRNGALRGTEVERRLNKVERDHEALMGLVGGFARSFGELGLSPVAGMRRELVGVDV